MEKAEVHNPFERSVEETVHGRGNLGLHRKSPRDDEPTIVSCSHELQGNRALSKIRRSVALR